MILILILFELKQRVCEWRGEIAKKALQAVERFFGEHQELTTPEGRATYVAWAVPENHFTLNRVGVKIIVPPEVYPYMWEIVEMKSGKLVSVSSFVCCSTAIRVYSTKKVLFNTHALLRPLATYCKLSPMCQLRPN